MPTKTRLLSIFPQNLAATGKTTTDNVTEGSNNLYYTSARANADFDTRLGTKSTTNLAEGTNLYYTSARANADFDTRLATKSTTNLAEGTNLYYTDSRVGTYLTSNNYATQSYVGTQLANLVDSSPATLDTLNELAAALGDDPNFATTTATAIGLKAPLASPVFTGVVETNDQFKSVGGGGDLRVNGNFNSNQAAIGTVGANSLMLMTTNTGRVYITSGGSVGIATNNPAEPLEVLGQALFRNNNTTSAAVHVRGAYQFAGIGLNRNTATGDLYDTTVGAYQLHNAVGNFELQRYNSAGAFQEYSYFVNGTTGYVGIGTNQPGSKLHITTSTSQLLRLVRTNNTVGIELTGAASGGWGLYDYYRSGYDLYMVNGKVGIGSSPTSPKTRLDINTGSDDSGSRSGVNALRIATPEADGIEWYLDHSTNTYSGWVASAKVYNSGSDWGDGYLRFDTSGTGGSALTTLVLKNGKVGIGITNPAEKLEVSGNIKATGGQMLATQTASSYTSTMGMSPYTTATNNIGGFVGNVIYSSYSNSSTGAGMLITCDYGQPLVFGRYYSGTVSYTETARFDGSGNLGLIGSAGTGNINAKLCVQASGGSDVLITARGQLSAYSYPNLFEVSASSSDGVLKLRSGGGIQGVQLASVTDGTNSWVCAGSGMGNFGVGTTSPGYKLEVLGSGDTYIRVIGAAGATKGGVIVGNNDATKDYGKFYFDNSNNNVYLGQYYSSGGLIFLSNSTIRAQFDTNGHFIPYADNSYNLGSTTNRWANIYTADAHFSNEGTEGNSVDGTTGNWTLQEGEDTIYMINNKTGKRFKIKMEEV